MPTDNDIRNLYTCVSLLLWHFILKLNFSYLVGNWAYSLNPGKENMQNGFGLEDIRFLSVASQFSWGGGVLSAPICMPVNRPSTRCPPQAHTDVEQHGVPSGEKERSYDKLYKHDVLAGNFTKLIWEEKQITKWLITYKASLNYR